MSTIEQQMEAVKSAASWVNQPTEEERRILLDAHFSLKGLLKKRRKVDPALYSAFVKSWMEAFPSLGFNKTSGAKIKEMIATCIAIVNERDKLQGNPHNLTMNERILGIFDYIIAYVKRTNHWCNGKSITTFESKLREIYTEIINGKRVTNSKVSARDAINAL